MWKPLSEYLCSNENLEKMDKCAEKGHPHFVVEDTGVESNGYPLIIGYCPDCGVSSDFNAETIDNIFGNR